MSELFGFTTWVITSVIFIIVVLGIVCLAQYTMLKEIQKEHAHDLRQNYISMKDFNKFVMEHEVEIFNKNTDIRRVTVQHAKVEDENRKLLKYISDMNERINVAVDEMNYEASTVNSVKIKSRPMIASLREWESKDY